MANKIQIRRGLKQDLPLLSIGEPALTTDTLDVYVGGGTQNIELAKKSYVDGQFTTIADQINDITTNGVSKLASYEYDLYATYDNQTVFEIPYELFETNTDTLMVFFDGMKRPKSDYVVTDPVNVGGVITKGYITLTEGRPINSYVGLEILKNVVNDASGVFSGSLIAENSTPQSKIIGLEEALNNIDTSIGNAVSFVSVEPGTSEPVQPFSEYDFKQHIMDLETNVGDKSTLTTTDKTSLVKAINENTNNISNPNLIINGDFQVWQRGTSVSTNSGVKYTADRWCMWNTGTSTIANADWNMVWTCGGNDNLMQVVEMPMRNIGAELVLSCMIMIPVEASVTISCAGCTSLLNADSGVNKMVVGDGSWQNISLIIPSSVNSKSLFRVSFSCYNAGVLIGLTNVKLEVGSKATRFIARLYSEELTLCQRYYEKSYADGIPPKTNTMYGSVSAGGFPSASGGLWFIAYPYKVPKRSNPSVTVYNNIGTEGYMWADVTIDGYTSEQIQVLGTSSTSGTNILRIFSLLPEKQYYSTNFHFVSDSEIY